MDKTSLFVLIATYVTYISGESPSDTCVCGLSYVPVCGTDGVTYGNPCSLECAQRKNKFLELAYMGNCKEPVSAVKDCGCNILYLPVCGSNGRTYHNKCLMDCEGNVMMSYLGPCMHHMQKREAAPPCVCTREMKQVCGSDGRTYGNPCMLNCATMRDPSLSVTHSGPCAARSGDKSTCACTRNFKPVCGSDGQTYNNECLLRCSGNDVALSHEGPC